MARGCACSTDVCGGADSMAAGDATSEVGGAADGGESNGESGGAAAAAAASASATAAEAGAAAVAAAVGAGSSPARALLEPALAGDALLDGDGDLMTGGALASRSRSCCIAFSSAVAPANSRVCSSLCSRNRV